jgi:hypothetical protein
MDILHLATFHPNQGSGRVWRTTDLLAPLESRTYGINTADVGLNASGQVSLSNVPWSNLPFIEVVL